MRSPISHPPRRGRLVACLSVLGSVAAAWLVLAPAGPARPGPRAAAHDFEQPLPAVTRVAPRGASGSGEGPVTYRSAPIVAPARFDAAGLAGELRPVELRGRDTGGEWGPWMEAADGDPAWFGGADELQLRTRGWRPEGTLHYVKVSRGATDGAPPKPGIVSRKEWGADARKGGCRPREPASYGLVKATVVHHTVNSNKYTEAEAPGVVLAICRYHRNALGWNDVGYNALVDRFGNIYAGRAGGLNHAVIGAHAQGVNAQTSGVAAIGTHTTTRAGRPAMRALTRWLAWKLVIHGHTTKGSARMVSAGGETSRYAEGTVFHTKRIIGHRRTNLTECPGNALARQLSTLRERVQNLIDRSADGGDTGGINGR